MARCFREFLPITSPIRLSMGRTRLDTTPAEPVFFLNLKYNLGTIPFFGCFYRYQRLVLGGFFFHKDARFAFFCLAISRQAILRFSIQPPLPKPVSFGHAPASAAAALCRGWLVCVIHFSELVWEGQGDL